jgi:hypothetical protein
MSATTPIRMQSAVEILEAHARALQEQRDELAAALRALRADHSIAEPHHDEDLCPLCRQADAALAAFRDKA